MVSMIIQGITREETTSHWKHNMNKSDRIERLQSLLIECMLDDLSDPDKCTPGLYQVVRGIISDNREQLDSIPDETLDFLEGKFKDSIPFRKEA